MRPSRLLQLDLQLLLLQLLLQLQLGGALLALGAARGSTSGLRAAKPYELHAAADVPRGARPPPLEPWWPWSWKTLPVWGSGQGSSDFSPGAAKLLAKYPVIWTQGQQFPGARQGC